MKSVYYSPDKILLVHDKVIILDAIKNYLEANSYEVDCVMETEHAKLLMEVLPYSTVIIDRSLLRGSSINENDIICYLAQWHPKTRIMILDMAETIEIAKKLLPQTPVTAH